ncbi:hypothetical protein I317_03113 [Kwoniella heveanensis CBS 569]|uniref:Domain of unknown function at the cortex 1 domain-containing protein n=1 Tax=Kwoniella heveanensis BCC8398 TaxID=1296120 RepID=A0A1B9GLL1_9TREE|nr:hypothetical protein I316_06354 [Kwoniella heveanensis BCC8398]OCF43022.1 hypothetical protein I317_03113 [Kwoniella heveanensis CBS 569]
MAPRLRVLIPSKGGKGYPPTAPCPVNATEPTPLITDGFEGSIWVFVKGYNGDHKAGDGDEYFKGRDGISYGIVVKGKFKDDFNADEVLFGNVFEKPIRDNLPWGTSIATKFMYFVDPTVEADIYADKPWALSPALATMSHLSLASSASSESTNNGVYVTEDTGEWLEDNGGDTLSYTDTDEKAQISARRKWLGKKDNRRQITVPKDTFVGMEFCNGLLDFNTLSAQLPPPFSLSIPLLKYWDGQPVTYVCQNRPPAGQSPVGTDTSVHFSVAFEIVDEEAKRALEAKGGAVHTSAPAPDKKIDKDDKEIARDDDEEEENNDDVD